MRLIIRKREWICIHFIICVLPAKHIIRIKFIRNILWYAVIQQILLTSFTQIDTRSKCNACIIEIFITRIGREMAFWIKSFKSITGNDTIINNFN